MSWKVWFIDKGVTKKVKYEAKEKTGWVLGMLLGTLAPNLLGIALARRKVVRDGDRIIQADERVIRPGERQDF